MAYIMHTDINSGLSGLCPPDREQKAKNGPDGKYVFSGGHITARVWEAATGQEIARMTHAMYVHSVAFSPDGKYVVSGGGDYAARVWDAATGQEVARMTHDREVHSVAFTRTGREKMRTHLGCTGRFELGKLGPETQGRLEKIPATCLEFTPEPGALVVRHVQPDDLPAMREITGELFDFLAAIPESERKQIPGGALYYLDEQSGQSVRIKGWEGAFVTVA